MPTFPPHLAQDARAQGLRLSPFEWTANDIPGREAASGTAVVGAPDLLQAFLDRFVAAHVSEGVRTIAVPADTGSAEGVRAVLVPPGTQTVESVLYFPNYFLEGE